MKFVKRILPLICCVTLFLSLNVSATTTSYSSTQKEGITIGDSSTPSISLQNVDFVDGDTSVVFSNTASNDYVLVPVAVRVNVINMLGYHYSNDTCYSDYIATIIDYEDNVYSPEVCSYSGDVDNMSFTANGRTNRYPQAFLSEVSVDSEPHHVALGYMKELSKALYDEVTVSSDFGVLWSSNCMLSYTPHTFDFIVSIA